MDTEFSHGSEVVQEKFSTEQQLGRALLGLHLSCLLLAQRTSHRRERQFTGTLRLLSCAGLSVRQRTVAVAPGAGV